ncbi:MAG: uracil-DNA glycosylase [Desulfobacterales bacterium]
MSSRLSEILHETEQYLKFLRGIGCTGIGAGEKGRKIAAEWSAGPETAGDLSSLQARIKNCRRCRLADERSAVVFGQGNPSAGLMFVGSFPEAEDEKTGVAYSGEAGSLLTKIIEAMGSTRDSVYICHAVKCRPASERVPEKFEARACRTWLEQQVRAVAPDVICVLGGLAAQALLKTDSPISRLRGDFHEYMGIPVMPTYEPAYLLVHTAAKRSVWEDMKKVMEKMGL